VSKTLGEKYGFSTNFKHMVVSGLCKECKN
jgi:Fe2+ or Zn2+ uptake regulation protein